jgi:hypothetical protein
MQRNAKSEGSTAQSAGPAASPEPSQTATDRDSTPPPLRKHFADLDEDQKLSGEHFQEMNLYPEEPSSEREEDATFTGSLVHVVLGKPSASTSNNGGVSTLVIDDAEYYEKVKVNRSGNQAFEEISFHGPPTTTCASLILKDKPYLAANINSVFIVDSKSDTPSHIRLGEFQASIGNFLTGQESAQSGYLLFGNVSELDETYFTARGIRWGSKLDVKRKEGEDCSSIYVAQ